mmetsp:Transcript_48167/g.151099  ORF Transcript_48167/g.151099 Transcript_48167/m.151099 type:complete len:1021 (-) Transcript_48167:1684-4746(-)
MDSLARNASSPKSALADTDASGVDEAVRAFRDGPASRVTEAELASKRMELQMLRQQFRGNVAYKLSGALTGDKASQHNIHPPPRSFSNMFSWKAAAKEGMKSARNEARDNVEMNSAPKSSLRFSLEAETGVQESQKKNYAKHSTSDYQNLIATNLELEKQLENLKIELRYVRQELKTQHGREERPDSVGHATSSEKHVLIQQDDQMPKEMEKLRKNLAFSESQIASLKSQLFDSSEIISNQRKEIDRLQKAGLDFLDLKENAKDAEKKWSLHVEKLEAQIIDLQNELHALHSNRLHSTQSMLESLAGDGDVTLTIRVGKNVLEQDLQHLLFHCLEVPKQQVAELRAIGKSILLTIGGNGAAIVKEPAHIVLEIFRKFRNSESAFCKNYSPHSIEICKEKGVQFQLSRMDDECSLYNQEQSSGELKKFQESLDAKSQTISDYEEEIKRWKQAFKRLEDDLDNHHQLMEQRLELANSHIKLLQQERDNVVQSSFKVYAQSDDEEAIRNNIAIQSMIAEKDNQLRSTRHALDVLVHNLRQHLPRSGPTFESQANMVEDWNREVEQIVLAVSSTMQNETKARAVLEHKSKELESYIANLENQLQDNHSALEKQRFNSAIEIERERSEKEEVYAILNKERVDKEEALKQLNVAKDIIHGLELKLNNDKEQLEITLSAEKAKVSKLEGAQENMRGQLSQANQLIEELKEQNEITKQMLNEKFELLEQANAELKSLQFQGVELAQRKVLLESRLEEESKKNDAEKGDLRKLVETEQSKVENLSKRLSDSQEREMNLLSILYKSTAESTKSSPENSNNSDVKTRSPETDGKSFQGMFEASPSSSQPMVPAGEQSQDNLAIPWISPTFPSSTQLTLHASKPTYQGQLKDGWPNGRGITVWADGRIYDGYWSRGVFEGFGTCIWSNGDKYEGEWHDGFAHGKGHYTYANGDCYEGEFFQDKFNGFGAFTYKSGWKFRGAWEGGKLNGWCMVVTDRGVKRKEHFAKGVQTNHASFTQEEYGKMLLKVGLAC